MKNRTLLFVFGIILLMVAAVVGYVAVPTFLNTGSKALTRITPVEKPYLAKFNRLQIGMTYDQVIAIMGEPDRDALG